MEDEEANTSSHSTWETFHEQELLNSDSARLQAMLGDAWDYLAKEVLKGSSEDGENFCNASPFFRNLVAAQRTRFLFEKVFPLVAISVWEKEGIEAFPVSDVLRCRQVCQHWNQAVDKVVPQKFAFSGKSYFGKGSKDPKVKSIGNIFHYLVQSTRIEFFWNYDNLTDEQILMANRRSVHQFLQYFQHTHDPSNALTTRNPFIWGSTFLHMCPSLNNDINNREEGIANFRRLREGFTSMLSNYGCYVEDFELRILWNNRLFFEDPSWFSEWLLQTPNLKQFAFANFADRSYGDNHLAYFPLPKLRLLEKMDITSLPTPIFNELIRQNNHISELHLGNCDYNVFTVPLPNLKTFEMRNSPGDIVQKLGSPQVSWSLEKLELKGVRLEEWAGLFEVIQQKFAETLVSLTLKNVVQIGQDPFWLDCKQLRLTLPKLKKISLDLGEKIPLCLDFLLPMKNNLEEIFISYYDFDLRLTPQLALETSTAIIQIFGFEDKMLESNLWGMFERLKELRVTSCWQDSRYFRAGCGW